MRPYPTSGTRWIAAQALLAAVGAVLWGSPALAQGDASQVIPCLGELPQQALSISVDTSGTRDQPDVLVVQGGTCIVSKLGDYYYGTVHVENGGKLVFVEPPQQDPGQPNETNFWAESIIIENGGGVFAGVPVAGEDGATFDEKPYGIKGNTLSIVLYGADQSKGDPVSNRGTGVACVQPRCGIPDKDWNDGAKSPVKLPGDGGVEDYFYPYKPLMYDDKSDDRYFGYKVLALSYGGTLQLRGFKGTTGAAAADGDPTATGSAWMRLGADLKQGVSEITLDRNIPAGWKKGDKVVVTPTDYLPSHAEEFTIKEIKSATSFTIEEKSEWFHAGTVFPLKNRLDKAGAAYKASNAGNPLLDSAETRAAVGLLTRSIRIRSGGDAPGQAFPKETEKFEGDHGYYFGGHVVIRQGFKKLQIQGVEFAQLGQGGRMGHYPVHFHQARRVPDGTYIKDSVVNESMTHWYVLHSTQGVTLQRNIGYKSIGHGFYLEDATETDNKLYSNLGVFARGGVIGKANPRSVPGILAARNGWNVPDSPDPQLRSRWTNTDATKFLKGGDDATRVRSDVIYPTVFWITNGWNDFVGNMAAGANMCGACYWLVPAGNNGHAKDMKWSGYADLQQRHPGTSALKQFYKNYCSSAMHALNSVASGSNCPAIDTLATDQLPRIDQVKVSFAPEPKPKGLDDKYYPNLTGDRTPTACKPSTKMNDSNDSCLKVTPCDSQKPDSCAPTVVDSFTTSFNYAETNFAGIWLRRGWNLVDRLFMSDILNGGIGIISGGDYTRASVPVGYWAVLSNSVFVGKTQKDNKWSDPAGPAYPNGDTTCIDRKPGWKYGNVCISDQASVGYPLSNWSTNRMINIYDGPFYEYGNAYLDINTSECSNDQKCMWMGTPGVRRKPNPGGTPSKEGYLPNAAIGWKQPNGFYYPPAFHSSGLFFDNVDIRHYLTVPLFEYGTYQTDMKLLNQEYMDRNGANWNGNLFNNFTDVDRQTVLNDEDGTLTGFKKTISLNQDPFFSAPLQVPECLSMKEVLPGNSACAKPPEQLSRYLPTARTSPYEHVSLAMAPECAINTTDPKARCGSADFGGIWSRACGEPRCFGVRLYRQYLTDGAAVGTSREWQEWEKNGCKEAANADKTECNQPFIRLSGGGLWQRSGLTANGGKYYIDTTRTLEQQLNSDAIPSTYPKDAANRSVNVFQKGQKYYSFFLFARPKTIQTYQFWVGKGFNPEKDIEAVRMELNTTLFKANPSGKPMPWPTGWSRGFARTADGTVLNDVAEVTIDFSKLPKSIDMNPQSSPDTCKPITFCEAKGEGANRSCGCSLKDSSPLLRFGTGVKQACEQVCKTWAVKDLDYPEGGAVGFSFKMAADADGKDHRPQPVPFPTDRAGSVWRSVVFDSQKDRKEAGQCFYTKDQTPTFTGSCTAYDNPPQMKE